MNKERIYLYDNLKFLLILLVIAGHFIDYGGSAYQSEAFLGSFVFIYAFHMPLFIFISGLFFKAENIFKKVFFYFSTGIILNVVIFASQLLTLKTGAIDIVNVKGAPWFMYALGVYTALTYYLKRIDKRLVAVIIVIVALFAGYSSTINEYLSLSRIIVFYPYYYFASILDAKKVAEFTKKKMFKSLGAFLLALWGVLCGVYYDKISTLRMLFTGLHPYDRLPSGMAQYGWLYRLLCYVISSLLCFAVICLVPNKKLGIITTYGSRTLQVYFWHLTFVFIVHTLPIVSFFSSLPWGALCDVLICFAIAVLLSQKPFAYPTKLIKKYSFKEGEGI